MPYHKTILVVEDDPNDQTFILEAFRSIGVETPIQVVSTGSEAIAYLMGEEKYSDRAAYPYPTFIITDLKMPGGNGFSVLEHLQGNPEWSIIPKVVLSASEDPDDVKKRTFSAQVAITKNLPAKLSCANSYNSSTTIG